MTKLTDFDELIIPVTRRVKGYTYGRIELHFASLVACQLIQTAQMEWWLLFLEMMPVVTGIRWYAPSRP